MHPPTVSAFRQGSAQAARGAVLGFAKWGRVGQSSARAGCLCHDPRLCLDCTPLPDVRSALLPGRPDLFPLSDGHGSADVTRLASGRDEFCFNGAANTIDCAAITTLRGNEPCVNISSFLFLRPPAFRAVWQPRPSAALPVPSRVRPLRTQRMRTWSPVPRWAALSAPRPAVCRGCRPAVVTDLTVAFGRPATTTTRPFGQIARMAFFFCAHAGLDRAVRGSRGERCSRRS